MIAESLRLPLRRLVPVFVLLLAALPAAAPGAEIPDFTEPLQQATDDGGLTLVPSRPDAVVRQNLEDAQAMQAAAMDQKKRAESQQSLAKSLVEARKKAIESLKARLKMAADQKQESERLDLERQVKSAEGILKLLEKQSEMRDAEKNAADARRELGASMIRLFESEIEFAKKGNDQASLKEDVKAGGQIDKIMKGEKELRARERRVMDLLKEFSEKQEEAAKKAREVIEKRIQVFEAAMTSP